MGIDVAALVAEVEDVRQEVTSLGPERFEELAANRIPRIAFASESGVGAESVTNRLRGLPRAAASLFKTPRWA